MDGQMRLEFWDYGMHCASCLLNLFQSTPGFGFSTVLELFHPSTSLLQFLSSVMLGARASWFCWERSRTLPPQRAQTPGPHPPEDHGCSVVLVFKLKAGWGRREEDEAQEQTD